MIKLEVLEQYLSAYVTSLKNKGFKLCYIDAFAGSGSVNVRQVGPTEGSALRALAHDFDEFVFIDKEQEYLSTLAAEARKKRPDADCHFILGDCNELLPVVTSYYRYQERWRGVIFLDPYAMSLNWSSLASIASTRVLDVWYLFPLSALNRNLRKDGQIDDKTRERISSLLGTHDWEEELYAPASQISFFDEDRVERTTFNNLTPYIIRRLSTIFPFVSERSVILRQPENNSPLFLLCFAVSNPSKKAIELSMRMSNYILSSIK